MNQDILPVDLAYAAGIIDGEGTIGISERAPDKHHRSPTFTVYSAVVMTDLVIPVLMRDTFGVGTVHSYPPRNPGHKATHQWRISGPTAVGVLEVLRPYLRLKGPQADVAIEFYRSRVWKQNQGTPAAEIAARREAVTTIRALNKRGA